MKIVEIIPHLSSGGAERFVVDLCNELAHRHEVCLLLFYPLEDSALHFLLTEVKENVRVISLNKKKGFDCQLIGKLRRTIIEIAPDLVHSHGRAFTYTFAALRHLKGIPCYHTIHSDAEREAGPWPLSLMRRLAFRRGIVTPITISPESLSGFKHYYGIDAPMIVNGRALPKKDVATACGTPLRLVSVARISKVKRQDMLARICVNLEREGYDFRLQMVGQCQDAAVMEGVQNAGCKNLEIVGEVANPLDYLNDADAFCLPSAYEGMPISLIEAMAMGAVPVCTPVGGIINMVQDGVNGILSNDLSKEAYYTALKRFLDLPKEEISALKRNALDSAQAYTMANCAAQYETLWSNRSGNTIVLIGGINQGKTPEDGEQMKNQLFVKRFSEMFRRVIAVDTLRWKQRPWVLFKLLWVLLTHRNAKVIISGSSATRHLLHFLHKVPVAKHYSDWVIGGAFHEKVKKGIYKLDALQKCEHIIVEGETMQRELEAMGLKNVVYVPNFKPITFKPQLCERNADAPFRFVFLSRVMAEKGIPEILETVENLQDAGFNHFIVDIYGKIVPEYEETFRKAIAQLDKVNYCGFLNMLGDNSGYERLSGYDCMLFPTHWRGEGFPGVVIDANMAGLPIIATDWHLNRHYIHEGETGFLIPPHDAAALAEKMKLVMTADFDLSAMRRRCVEYVQQFDYRKVLSKELMQSLNLSN